MLHGGRIPAPYVDVMLMRELGLTPEHLGIETVTIGDLNQWLAALIGEQAGIAESRRRAAKG